MNDDKLSMGETFVFIIIRFVMYALVMMALDQTPDAERTEFLLKMILTFIILRI